MRSLFFSGLYFCLAVFLLVLAPGDASAAGTPILTVEIHETDAALFATPATFEIATGNDMGGASVAVADLGSDGTAEIIIGNGLGSEPRVTVYRADGSVIGDFLAYAADMGVGINVAACDLNGDGIREIATAPGRGGGPQVRVFSNIGEPLDNGGFFAYAEAFRGGVNLACGDLDLDGTDELVTLPAAGGGPHVRVWKMSGTSASLDREFFTGDQSDARGLVGLVLNGTLYVASSQGIPSAIQRFRVYPNLEVIHTSEQTDEDTARGVTGLFAWNGSPADTIEGSQHLVNLATNATTTVTNLVSPRAAAGDVDGDGKEEVIVLPGKPLYHTRTDPKYIVVDLSEQRLYAYENGILGNTFLVSTAKWPFTTPAGNHSVLAKLPFVDYTWSYGPGNPNNYSLGMVPWNLRIYPHVYIHYAYWHNNFGHPMSHGCINVRLDNMKWVYDWADVGIPVDVIE